jgi:membrane fusion protein (multidrug efflux system)
MKITALLLLAATLSLHAQEAPAVRTALPKKPAQTIRYEVPGRTEPLESATIYTRATGIISERKFDIGGEVKAGDVLAVVSAPEIDRAVEAARANVEQVKARANNALSLSNRSSRLLKSDVVSEEETEQRRTTAAESAAAVRVAEAELARLEEQQRFSTVRAPFDGIISARNFDRGDLAKGDAAPADGWLYRLDRLDTLRFVISATPDLALRLPRGEEVKVRFGEFPGREFSAQIAHASRVFDAGSGTMRVELLLENKDLALPAGLTGSASLDLKPQDSTHVVPANALISREGKTFVATAVDGRVRFIEVAPGRNFGREVEVVSDQLADTMPVILNPNAMLRDGESVAASAVAAAK